MSPFEANNGQNLRMEFKLRKKGKFKGTEKFVKRIKEVQEEAKIALGKAQEDMRRYADRHSVTPLVLFLFFFMVIENTHVVLMLCFCSWYLFLVPFFFYLPLIFHWSLCLATR